ncbi:MAG TPA: type II toxin-antitoxin system HicA family toxin [Thermoanaerobaculia bacterium]|nr:type II toxin-antitoxin system HicA family toxin [Thermoanaerobaculia bacterium]
MKVPRDLSGEALIKVLCQRWGYRLVHQVGSHAILETEDPSHQRIAVPAHKSLRIGTLHGILRAVSSHKGISREDLLASL